MKDFSDRTSDLALADPATQGAMHDLILTVDTPANKRSLSLPTNRTEMRRSRDHAYRRWGKRALDITLLLLTLPLTLPLILMSVLLLATERNPIFYWQKRVGQNGRVFRMVKLRTMVPGADQILEDCLAECPEMRREWDTTQKLKNDPRITKIGKILRSTSLDELPQLWNVLIGDMSLVGPRPMMPNQTTLYGDMRAYVAMRPGITGLWQVTDRNESDFTSRTCADRKYARFCSLGMDLKLIFKTVGVVVRGTGY